VTSARRPPVRLLHLSDIHFSKKDSGDVYDLDADLRNEIERDAAELIARVGVPTAIVITGDVAYGGKHSEFEMADEWLERLCSALNVPREQVFVVPGNHDIDRAIIDSDPLIADTHKFVRHAERTTLDTMVKRYFKDSPAGASALFAPLGHYNDFALKYQCAVTPEMPFWEHSIQMNDNSLLMVRGMNSTLISDSDDDDGANRLVLGLFQATCPNADGVIYLTLCHHPPDWLLDGEQIDDTLALRAKVQLFGHKHKLKIKRLDDSLRVTAGAAHPNRREPNWLPRYNYLVLEILGEGNARFLRVDVYARVWNDSVMKFVADQIQPNEESRHVEFALPSWWAPEVINGDPVKSDSTPPPIATRSHEEVIAVDPARRLIYTFYSLPFHLRIALAQELELITDEDRNLSEEVLFPRLFRRAADRGMLKDLWRLVQEQRGELTTDNPFDAPENGRREHAS
jgi:predicted phosphodiesterase